MNVGDLQATYAATLVDEFARAGVHHAVVCPGSRSTPLAVALDADRRVTVHVVLDERSAGFFALGLPLAVVLTTSGTAAAELHAAVIEAHHSRLPLVVCTADRPPDLHGVAAPQTIEQATLYGGGVLRWSASPGPVAGFPRPAWRSLASRAVAEATRHPLGPGPVHLNLAFVEPLVGSPGELPPGRDGNAPWHRAVAVPRRAIALPNDLVDGRRGLIVAGAGQGLARDLGERLRWPVLADPRSGCRGGDGSGVVAAFDPLLRDADFAERHRPEVVLRLGPPPASKVLGQWLAGLGSDVPQVVVDGWGWPDPDRTAALVLGTDDTPVLSADPVAAPEGWCEGWMAAEAAAQRAIDEVLAGHQEVTEPGVARALTRDLRSDIVLFAASSMPIRDLEWFRHPSSGQAVFANRGANGIDGLVSSALGVAAGWNAQVVALLGDLAFLHDSGGLLWARQRDLTCCFVVVDNDGGGIFNFLPQAEGLGHERFERLFGTPHGVDLAALARAHGLPYAAVAQGGDLVPAVQGALVSGGVHVVHVRTDRVANVALHHELFAAVATAIQGL